MAFAVALRREEEALSTAGAGRDEVLARYRHLRAISKEHHSAIIDSLPGDAVLRCARRLGIARGRTFILEDMHEVDFAFDLAIHTAEAGRSRAIDRYARSAKLATGSDEALVLEAMRQARFSIILIERRHHAAGLIAKDVIRRTEHWLIDIGLESSVLERRAIATRLFAPDRFSMTAGVLVPIDGEFMFDVLEVVQQLGRKRVRDAIDDRRFAEAIYRMALADSVMERVRFQEIIEDAG